MGVKTAGETVRPSGWHRIHYMGPNSDSLLVQRKVTLLCSVLMS